MEMRLLGSFLLDRSRAASKLASALVRGLAVSETVDDTVVGSDTALEDLDACGLFSSQVSHASLSVDSIEVALDGDFACLLFGGAFLAGVVA
jgi:hypothetical protein